VDGVERSVELVHTSELTPAAIVGAQGFVLVFSIHSATSFAQLKLDLEKILLTSSEINVPVMMIGASVSGRHREVEMEEAKELARYFVAGYTECHPESSFAVLFALTDLVRRMPLQERKRRTVVAGSQRRRMSEGGLLTRRFNGLFSW